jgi:hypothetical protein
MFIEKHYPDIEQIDYLGVDFKFYPFNIKKIPFQKFDNYPDILKFDDDIDTGKLVIKKLKRKNQEFDFGLVCLDLQVAYFYNSGCDDFNSIYFFGGMDGQKMTLETIPLWIDE